MKNLDPFTFMLLSLVWLSLVLLLPTSASSQSAGNLDPAFGDGGTVIENINGNEDALYAMAIQPDGKIVGAGYFSEGTSARGAVCRLLPDGTPDANFAQNGVFHMTSFSILIDVAVQPDGKIIACGYTNSGDNPVVIRLKPNGTYDNTFGNGGTFIATTSYNRFSTLTLLPDGKILLAGYGWSGGALTRLLPNGTPDLSFNGSGTVILPSFGTDYTFITDVVALPSGRIITSGYIDADTSRQGIILGFTSNGVLDPDYALGGILTIGDPGGYTGVLTTLLLPDGKLLLGGYYSSNSDRNLLLARLLPDGLPDDTFGFGGTTITDAGGQFDNVRSLCLLPDGSVGGVGYTGSFDFYGLLLKWSYDGIPDDTFGTDGVINPGWPGTFWGMAVLPDGKWIVTGVRTSGDGDFGVAKYGPDGSPDLSFGPTGEGYLALNFSGSADYAFHTEIDAQGHIFTLGASYVTRNEGMLLKYQPDGTRDAGFGDNGLRKRLFVVPDQNEYVNSSTLQPDGKILICGMTRVSSGPPMDTVFIGRLNADGTIDKDFGQQGRFTYTKGMYFYMSVKDVQLQADGRILYAGQYQYDIGKDTSFVGRLLPNGQPDPEWGQGGLILADDGVDIENIHITPDNKVIVAGDKKDQATTYNHYIGRLNSNGSPDTGYGTGGFTSSDLNNAKDLFADFNIAADGSALAVAIVIGNSISYLAVFKYLPNGMPDLAFGNGGYAIVPTGTLPNINIDYKNTASIDVQPDGKIVVAGTQWFSGSNDIIVYRLLPNGTPDSEFGSGGSVNIDVFGYRDFCRDMMIRPNGKILITGYTDNGKDNDAILISLLSGLVVSAGDFSNEPHHILMYPNPVTDQSVLRYDNPADGQVSIDLTDMQGRLLQTFFSGRQQAGPQELPLHFDSTLPAGTYICRITTEKGAALVRLVKAGRQ